MATKTKTTTKDSLNQKLGIRLLYAPKGNEKIMRDRVYHRYHAMQNSLDRKKAELEWERARKQWEALREQRQDDEWQSNHYVPMTTSVVESALSEVIDESPRPLILPRGSEDVPKAEVMSHIFDYTWSESNSDLEFEDVLHDAFIEGTGIGQEYFYSDFRKIKTSQVTGSNDNWNEEIQKDYNDCYLECVKNDDFFVDENARYFGVGPYGARDCIRRYIMNIDDFKNFFQGPVWDPLDNASKVIPGGNTNYYEFYNPPQGIDHSKQVEVLWYWARKPDDWLCIVANDIMVVMGPNPYKHKELPFMRALDVKRTHRFYGKGEAMMLESIQDELNTLRRMVIDRNHLDIDKMFIGSNKLNLSEEDLIARPHGFIPSDDVNSIKAVEYNDIPRSVELSMQHLEDDATVVTGINPRAQALPTTGTATEAAILKESTLKRIRLKVRRIEIEFLTRLARLRVSNILQFYPEQKMEKIVGEEETQEYKDAMASLQAKGYATPASKPGQAFKQIRLQNVDLSPDATGNFQQKTISGFSFFPLNPDYYLPARGGFDIRFESGATLPISKPLMKQESNDLYDRLIQVALGVQGTYDPVKLGDMLIKADDRNPEDLKVDKQQNLQDDSQARLQMAIDLANTENNLMIRGKDVPPTAFAPPAHTAIHTQFTASPDFQKLTKDDPRVKIFIQHITGEIAAQQERENGTTSSPPDPSQPEGAQPNPQGAPGQAQTGVATPTPSSSMNGGNKTLQNIMPNKIQGGGMAPSAI